MNVEAALEANMSQLEGRKDVMLLAHTVRGTGEVVLMSAVVVGCG